MIGNIPKKYKAYANAPGVVKLFGEHAVIYGKMCIAAAIDIYASVKIYKIKNEKIELEFKDIPTDDVIQRISLQEIISIYDDFLSRTSIKEFLKKHKKDNKLLLPSAVIIGELHNRFNVDVRNIRIVFSSEIPIQYGLASSAALSCALAVAISNLAPTKISDAELIEIARNGEKIIHENDNAGMIDINTSFYGNIVSFNSDSGAKSYKLNYELPLLLIDTGPKEKTSKMVEKVANLYKRNKKNTESIFNNINECSTEGLSALMKKNIEKTGKLMYKNQDLLSSLGISSKGIDNAVKIAKENGGYGAKLSGGGGGGIVIAVPENKKELTKAILKSGLKISETKISLKGAVKYRKK
jgi:mevalonate kinase